MAEEQPKSIADLFEGLPYRHYRAKTMILYQGDPITRLFYIISGYVKMYNITSRGNERTLMVLGPGESVPLIQSQIAEYFYDALTDVEVAHGTYDEIVKRFLADEKYMQAARDSGVRLMHRMMRQMEILASDTAEERLKQMLCYLSEYYGEEQKGYSRLRFKITHQELANMINATRETVTQIMGKFEGKKFVRFDNDGFLTVKKIKNA